MKNLFSKKRFFLTLGTAILTAFIGLFAEGFFNHILCENITYFCGSDSNTINPDELSKLLARILKYVVFIFWFILVFAIWAGIWLKHLEDISTTLRDYLDNEKKINSLYGKRNRLYVDKNEITLISNPVGEPAIEPPANPNGIFDVFITHENSAFQDLFLCPTYFSYLVKRANNLDKKGTVNKNYCLYKKKIRLLVVDEDDIVFSGKEINPVFITYLSICDSLGYKTYIIKKVEYKALCQEFSVFLSEDKDFLYNMLMSRPSLTYFDEDNIECDYFDSIEEKSILRNKDKKVVLSILAILCAIINNDSANYVNSTMNHNIIIDAIRGSGIHHKRTLIIARETLNIFV